MAVPGTLVINGVTYNVTPASAAEGDSVVKLTINGQQFTVDVATDDKVNINTTLNEFIRTKTPFTGTKRSCGEGGCGSCIVTMADGRGGPARAINSCLYPIVSCNGKAFTTVEGVGTTEQPHKIQTALAGAGGSQCGYCTPGFTMSMYGLLGEKGGAVPTQEEIMNALRGNICRCTGFRPIVEGFEKACQQQRAEEDKVQQVADDMGLQVHADNTRSMRAPLPRKVTPMVARSRDATVTVDNVVANRHKDPKTEAQLAAGDAGWEEIASEAQLKQRLADLKNSPTPPKDLMLVGGRTSIGIWKTRRPDLMLHIGDLDELRFCRQTDAGFEFGSCATLTEVIEFASALSGDNAKHMPQFVSHLKKVAAPGIRNAASIGGNVMLTHLHQDATDNFAYSDVTTVLYGLGATLFIQLPGDAAPKEVSFDDFYAMDLKFAYLQKIVVPFAQAAEEFHTFRIAARASLAHSYVVGAFRAIVDAQGVIPANSAPRVAFGGVFNHPQSIPAVEAAMKGTTTTDITTFQSLCQTLTSATAALNAVAGRVDYRKNVVLTFFYKFYLNLQKSLPASLQSGAASWVDRPEGYTSNQTYDTPDPSMGPLTQPEPKLSALSQCTGEAQYTGDLPEPANLVHLCPVLSNQIGKFSVDLSKAQEMPGYIGWFAASDLGFGNSVAFQGPVFAKGSTEYLDQIIGVVIAKSAPMAADAARAVVINYSSTKTPVVNIDDAIAAGNLYSTLLSNHTCKQGNAKSAIKNAANKTSGSFKAKEQYHFHMETQTAMAVTRPDGKGVDIHCSTQVPSLAKQQVCLALGIILNQSDIQIEVYRCGGGYGGKLFNSARVALIAAAVTKKRKMPAKIVMEIDDNMKAMGQRYPWRFDYNIAYQPDGKITAVDAKFYCDSGSANLEAPGAAGLILQAFDNCYNIPNWNIDVEYVKTPTPPGTSARGPGFVPGIYVMEQMVAAVAAQLNVPVEQVREKNYYAQNDVTPWGDKLLYWSNMTTILERLKASSDYDKRVQAVAAYNAANKWTKKGISLTPVKYAMDWDHIAGTYNFDVALTVNPDGSVEVVCSGVELGQGLNTKVAQTICYKLGIKEEQITFQANSTATVNDLGSITGFSTSSELCVLAAENACDEVQAKLMPVRRSLTRDATWRDVCAQAVRLGVSASAKGKSNKNRPANTKGKAQYESYSAVVNEVLLDVLTGEVAIVRSDILFDAGRSLNPLIDVGQVEGGYTMGVGYALYEEFQDRDYGTGLRPVHNTWEYHTPAVFDMPQTFNVGLLKGFPCPTGVLKTKATAEPPVCLGVGVLEAVNNAVSAAAGRPKVAAEMPFTVDQRHLACEVQTSQFTFQ